MQRSLADYPPYRTMSRARGCQITGYPNETDGIPNHGQGWEVEGVGGKEAVGISMVLMDGEHAQTSTVLRIIQLWCFCVNRQLQVITRNGH
jgi:hypothetical protein